MLAGETVQDFVDARISTVNMLSISVIIPVHKGGSPFAECLDALMPSVAGHDEVIVVADGAAETTCGRAVAEGARVIVNVQRRGPAFARNLGARAASGDILLFVDADVLVQPNTVDLIRDAFEQDARLAAVIGSYDSEPGAKTFLSQYRNLLHHFTHQSACEEAATFWGACGAIRREVFVTSGWFDESYTEACVEDIELGYRLNKAGYRIALRKDIQVKHLKRWTAESMIQTDVFARAVPWTELLLRYHTFRNDLNLRLENRLSTMLVFGLLASVALGIGIQIGAGIGAAGLFLLSAVMAALLILLNISFYNLLRRKHGIVFVSRAIPWHWLFYAYSGIGFLLGILRYAVGRTVPGRPAIHSVPEPSMKGIKHEVNAKWAEAAI